MMMLNALLPFLDLLNQNMVVNMSFVHFTFGSTFHNPRKEEPIIIHLEHSVFEQGILDELESIIRKSLKDGTWTRTTLIPPSPLSIDGTPMDSKVSIDIVIEMCNEILTRLQGEDDE